MSFRFLLAVLLVTGLYYLGILGLFLLTYWR